LSVNCTGKPKTKLKKKPVKFEDIKILILDVDGVLTNGAIVVNPDGRESKFFNVLDGHGIKMWRRAGLKVALLSGRTSEPTHFRAEQLEIDYCLENCRDKLPPLKKLLADLAIAPEQAVFIGDDLPDVPPMRYVGFAVAVANAVDEVKQHADFVTTRSGGKGAVREVIEYILKKNGKWETLLERYIN
jgi:3-deoxy-D-manno-octulosonate 8-phosphate phosphatase (KDO 8-P phosphatase)